ncbi:MAG: PKD domain-containing protein [Tepidisphaeraceae bacterium]
MAIADIHLLPTDQIAGMAVYVHALDTPAGFPRELSSKYAWDFGDPASKYNRLPGWNAAHIYAQAGSYSITLKITDESGKSADFHQTVEIAPAHRAVYYISAAGDDANDGLSPQHPIRSLTRMTALMADHREFLFHRGDTFSQTATLGIAASDVGIGAYPNDETERPHLVWSGPRREVSMIQISRAASNVRIGDLVFDSVFTSDTSRENLPNAIDPAGTNVAIARCRFLNVADAVSCELAPTGVLVQDCDAPQVDKSGLILPIDMPDLTSPGVNGLRAYFLWGQGSDIVLLGNRVANSTREHCVRIGGASRVMLAYNIFQNLDRTGVDKDDIAKTSLAAQIGDHLYAAANEFRNGVVEIGPTNAAAYVNDPTQKAARFDWAVFENNTLRVPMVFDGGSAHVRVEDNTSTIERDDAYFVNGYDTNYHRGVEDVTFIHNSARLNGPSGCFLCTTGKAQGLKLSGNTFTAANLKTGYNIGVLVIGEADLSSFDSITANHWPLDGRFWFDGAAGIAARRIGPAEWLQQPKVTGDQFGP